MILKRSLEIFAIYFGIWDIGPKFILGYLKKLELVFIKHYAPNSLPLTVNSHHVLSVKRLPKFSKGHNSEKIR